MVGRRPICASARGEPVQLRRALRRVVGGDEGVLLEVLAAVAPDLAPSLNADLRPEPHRPTRRQDPRLIGRLAAEVGAALSPWPVVEADEVMLEVVVIVYVPASACWHAAWAAHERTAAREERASMSQT